MNSDTICVKKTFPAKYIKYLSYGLYIIKQMYSEEEYKQKAAEYLKLSESVNYIIDDIENGLTDENEDEVKLIKKSLVKKPKRIRNPKPKQTITEQIVELANQPTIQRGPTDDVEYVIAESDSETEKEEPKIIVVEEVVKPVAKKVANKRTKKADIDDDPRPNPTWIHPIIPSYESDSEDEEEAPKVIVVEKAPEVIVVEEVVKPVVKKVAKKVTKKEAPKVVAEEAPKVIVEEAPKVIEAPKEAKKVSKPKAKKQKNPEVVEVALVVEELSEENEM